jgi:hypothetical protein
MINHLYSKILYLLFINMIFTNNKYYIIRIGNFAINGNSKILYFLFSLFICIEEYITIKSIDCFKIMFGSSLLWAFIELLLHISKTRIIEPMYIGFGDNKKLLNIYSGIFLQGLQEGGFVTSVGLYFGDRLYNYKYLLFLHFFIIFIISNIHLRNNDYTLSSKRQINTPMSIFLMTSITLYNIKSIYQNPIHNFRQIKMLFVMVYICSIWSFTVWYKGFRKVEILIKNNNNNEYIQKDVNYFNTLLIIGYDIIFEIGIAYLTFYNLFII